MYRPRKDAPTEKLTGTIVGMQALIQQFDKNRTVEVELLNLLGAAGLQSLPLEQVQTVRFLNPTLQTEFERALQVLASVHDTQKKTVNLQFLGNGKRHVKVGYVVERPIWKTSYRLLLKDKAKLFMQGWLLVENTSDDDWKGVRVILVSGRPISYQMNMYEPLYLPRPWVEPELFASLRPPVYSGAMGGDKKEGRLMLEEKLKPLDKVIRDQKTVNGQIEIKREPTFPMPDSQSGGQRLTFEELQQRREQLGKDKEKAKKLGAALTGMNFKEGITSVATAEELGEYYQYVIEQKVNLPRQKSAMLPILNQHLDGSKVSIFNEAVHSKYPLLGLRLKNTSGQPLTQGPITVYEDGAYAGDTRILDLQPGEERLLSYALDQATEVKVTSTTSPSPDMTFKIGGDNLTADYKLRQTRNYTIKNRATHERLVILEHPIRSDWKLITPAKALEKSRDVYRFQVLAPAGQTVTFDVIEEQGRLDLLALTSTQDSPPFYAIAAGVEVKPLTKVSPEELLSLKIAKGVLLPTYRTRESKTYFVQNNSDEERTFTVDHLIRKEYKRLSKDGDQVGPAVYRFILTVAAHKTGQQEVVEDRTYQNLSHPLSNTSEETLRKFLANPAVNAKVKDALKKYLDLQNQVAETKRLLDEQKSQLKILTDDQARLRENLKIIPATSDPYKGFLQKFVAQEAEIDGHQKQIRQLEAALLKQQRALETFVQR